jgi:hypothetical protein
MLASSVIQSKQMENTSEIGIKLNLLANSLSEMTRQYKA